MPKAQIPVGSIKAAVTGQYGPATWVNVFYLLCTPGTSTPGEVIAQVVSYLHDFYNTVITPSRLSEDWKTQYTTVSYRDAEDSLVRLRIADAVVGTSGGYGQAAEVAFLFNWGTGDPRRGGKPRQYVCGVPDNQMLDSARLVDSAQSAINAALITWLEDGPTLPIPLQLVEMSFRDGNTWRTEPVTYPIIGGNVNPVVASQRRRVDRLRPR